MQDQPKQPQQASSEPKKINFSMSGGERTAATAVKSSSAKLAPRKRELSHFEYLKTYRPTIFKVKGDIPENFLHVINNNDGSDVGHVWICFDPSPQMTNNVTFSYSNEQSGQTTEFSCVVTRKPTSVMKSKEFLCLSTSLELTKNKMIQFKIIKVHTETKTDDSDDSKKKQKTQNVIAAAPTSEVKAVPPSEVVEKKVYKDDLDKNQIIKYVAKNPEIRDEAKTHISKYGRTELMDKLEKRKAEIYARLEEDVKKEIETNITAAYIRDNKTLVEHEAASKIRENLGKEMKEQFFNDNPNFRAEIEAEERQNIRNMLNAELLVERIEANKNEPEELFQDADVDNIINDIFKKKH